MSQRLFLSYSSSDVEHVDRVRRQVAPLGVELYAADHDVQAGQDLEGKILEAIRESEAVVVLLTTNGFNSAFVQQEVGAARMAGKLVVPLVGTSVDRQRLGMLQGAEYIEFEPDRPEGAMERLSLVLGRLVQSSHELESRELQRQRDALLLALFLVLVLLAISSSPG